MSAHWLAWLLAAGLAGGMLLMLAALVDPREDRPTPGAWSGRLTTLAAEAGVPGMTPGRFTAASAGSAAMVFVLVTAVSRSSAVALILSLFAASLPLVLLRRRRAQRLDRLRGVWPDVIDDLASAVRAGLSLPEALEQLGRNGPELLQGPFRRFAEEYRVGGRFGDSLDRLKAELADPVGDRVVEALRVAREVGGSDLGRVLRTLADFLREEARTRGELLSRQSWTVNAARLAVAAPWVLLMLLSTRPEAVAAYDSRAGVVVLMIGAATSVTAYRLMIRMGRLPLETRVLR